MVAVISCSHFPDDERIYHREISALLEKNYVIKYFTLSSLKINLSQAGIYHKNYDLSKVTSDEYLECVKKDLIKEPPEVVHIHEPELFPVAVKMKKLFGTKIDVIFKRSRLFFCCCICSSSFSLSLFMFSIFNNFKSLRLIHPFD